MISCGLKCYWMLTTVLVVYRPIDFGCVDGALYSNHWTVDAYSILILIL